MDTNSIHPLTIEDLFNHAGRIKDGDQNDPDAPVFVKVGDKLYPLKGVEYDPGVEAESIEEEDEDGLEVEAEEEDGEESRVILVVGDEI